MTGIDLREFMNRHQMNSRELSGVIGVTPSAVEHWCSGKRTISLTVSRLCKTFDRYPQLMAEFGTPVEDVKRDT